MNKVKSLEQLGLHEKEAKAYIALLEVGHGSILDVAKKAELPKSSTHDLLKSLVHKGLAHTYIKKNRKFFAALEPKTLKEKHQKQEETLNKLLPELETIHNVRKDKPSVRFFEGRSGFKQATEEILSEAEEVCIFTSPEDMFARFPDFAEIFSKERAKRGIPLRALFRDSEVSRERHKTDKEFLRKSKLIKAPLPFSSTIFIWNNKVATITVKDDINVVITESEENVAAYRSIFEMLWEQTPDC